MLMLEMVAHSLPDVVEYIVGRIVRLVGGDWVNLPLLKHCFETMELKMQVSYFS